MIEKDGSPSLAKSHKNVSEGKHEFVIDTTKKLSGGKDLTYDYLKKSLEGKLGVTYGVSVSGDLSKIVVSYEGSEKAFLKAVSKTRIRTKFKTSLAQVALGGDAGIRAQKKALAKPKPTEVLATIAALKKDHMKVVVLEVGGKGMSGKLAKKPTKILPSDGKFKVGDPIYFVPVAKVNDKWNVKNLRRPE